MGAMMSEGGREVGPREDEDAALKAARHLSRNHGGAGSDAPNSRTPAEKQARRSRRVRMGVGDPGDGGAMAEASS